MITEKKVIKNVKILKVKFGIVWKLWGLSCLLHNSGKCVIWLNITAASFLAADEYAFVLNLSLHTEQKYKSVSPASKKKIQFGYCVFHETR